MFCQCTERFWPAGNEQWLSLAMSQKNIEALFAHADSLLSVHDYISLTALSRKYSDMNSKLHFRLSTKYEINWVQDCHRNMHFLVGIDIIMILSTLIILLMHLICCFFNIFLVRVSISTKDVTVTVSYYGIW